MVIDPNNINSSSLNSGRLKSANNDKGKSEVGADTGKSPAKSSDSVSLSDTGQSFARIESAINATPEIDSAKIEQIKNELANGNYPLDIEKIATKMLQSDDFLG